MAESLREKQMAEVEELLSDRLAKIGFARALYFGHFLADKLLPYPDIRADTEGNALLQDLCRFCDEKIDPVAIDRNSRIPDDVIDGLGKMRVLGACLPKSTGGLGLSQTQYCRLVEQLAGHCGSTSLFVNAHHSIGPRAIVLFGNEEQKKQWLPKLATGEWISAFALTEPEAGSDAGNVQTMATPTEDGSGYRLTGQKRWITNGGIAQALTVMARTPVEGSDETKVTAFLVSPDMDGFEVVEERMDKCGVRGTATGRLAFNNMFVPRENVLGDLGKGLKIALTVLDYGRTTFGASCTGAAKFCVEHAVRHCNSRVQFQQSLGSFELVKQKLASMKAGAFAMESATYQTAALMDLGDGDYMVETAMLKVFATEVLWEIINDTIQLYGGKGYFTDEPFERMMRDARINTIGEGANDVLKVFIAAVGMRDVGMDLQGVLHALKSPFGNMSTLGRFAKRKLGSLVVSPHVPVKHAVLTDDATKLGIFVGKLGSNVERLLRKYQEDIVDSQYHLRRIADVATEIYVSASVLKRLDFILSGSNGQAETREDALMTGRYYLQTARRRMQQNLDSLWSNDDPATTELADLMLARDRDH
ncbi:MAG: acyl-CoA dehydrogenase family protein [Pirellulales bacterium]|nr:acyl-CoA dehydrogenase family protein [Pirellulales bacterium]